MRDYRRNQQIIEYQLYGDGPDSTDEFGNAVKTYGDKKTMRICTSVNTSESEIELFGKDLKYDRVMSTHNMACKIDEFSRVFFDGDEYRVKKVAKSLTAILYAIEKIEVNRG